MACAIAGRPGYLVAALVVIAAVWGPEVPSWFRARHPLQVDDGSWRRQRRWYALGEIVGGLAATTAYPLSWRMNGVGARSNGVHFRHDPTGQFIVGLVSLFGVALVVVGVVELLRRPER